uniref:CSD domain-containing protein n=1 Tax=Noctiluca scintillans TaxID=2966 RepID=A0A7S1A5H1_NOCSC|mmetsp:Transcript_31447/g.83767  ORF Transcript_31447/g.83767 Transcript_31447/m.83767 type:complete len:726 (+) Transcript_31447:133-2310(+)|eukprot:CAMPEP_0194529282 /NCGR_PEP_ID=MMETSP0253-20130528/65916_1 /TAXON_ID=2966 /ORGANISM="Noctiluca scintillans" /LENGTH=725 /DNA_ID=CAMNT_0039374413 /DNA_START=120 /DNA_END=2297 /DNA_ORIENTATION=-
MKLLFLDAALTDALSVFMFEEAVALTIVAVGVLMVFNRTKISILPDHLRFWCHGQLFCKPDEQHGQGFVRSYSNSKEFGFIQCPGIAKDVFFHRNDCVPLEGFLHAGVEVTFEKYWSPGGSMRAKNLQIVSDPLQDPDFKDEQENSNSLVPRLDTLKVDPVLPAPLRASPGRSTSAASTTSGDVDEPLSPTSSQNTETKETVSGERLRGTVVSFDASSGYGLIVSPVEKDGIWFSRRKCSHADDDWSVRAGDTVMFTRGSRRKCGKPFAENVAPVDDCSDTKDWPAVASSRPKSGGETANSLETVSGAIVDKQGDSEISWECEGRLKSFSSRQAFGFIVASGVSEDVWFHAVDLPREQGGLVEVGRTVSFQMYLSPGGRLRARHIVLSPSGSAEAGTKTAEDAITSCGVNEAGGTKEVFVGKLGQRGEACEGRVKKFCHVQSIGFIRSATVSDDIWFCADDLARSCGEHLRNGQLVIFELYYSSTGRPRARHVVSQDSEPNETLRTGIVKRTSGCQYFGRIKSPDMQQDVFFNRDAIIGSEDEVASGVLVQYVLWWSATNRPRAKCVKRMLVEWSRSDPVSYLGRITSFRSDVGLGTITCEALDEEISVSREAIFGACDIVSSASEKLLRADRILEFRIESHPVVGSRAYDCKLVQRPDEKGVVKSFNAVHGFGFLTNDTSDGDVFFSSKDMIEVFDAVPGMVVSFEPSTSQSGKIRARGIRLCS